ncbi:Dbl homology domain-containing protein [Blastocladiella britannica]|nr:Dbl homology domain-containing protein [Blastocladiella britannica]
MYSIFINAFDRANSELDKWINKRKKLRQFLNTAKTDARHHQLNFQAYLLLPIQRIPRYRLLLLDLLKHTPVDHPDHEELVKALGEVERRAAEINERKRDQENTEKLLALHAKLRAGPIKEELMKPHRKLLREGDLTLVRTARVTPGSPPHRMALDQQRVGKEFAFFLFNDLLVQCKRESGGDKLDPSRALSLAAYVHPASLTPEGLLRVVDQSSVMYLSGSDMQMRAWAEAMNERFSR